MTVDVTPVNDPPTATSDTATVEEGTTLSVAVLALLSNDTDPEDDTLEISEVGITGDGTISLDGSTITYEYDGTETTTTGGFTVTDDKDSASGMVTVTVRPAEAPHLVLWIALALGAVLVTVMVLVPRRARRLDGVKWKDSCSRWCASCHPLSPFSDKVGYPPRDHDDGGVGVGPDHIWHHRGVDRAKTVQTAHLAVLVLHTGPNQKLSPLGLR